jgi:ABC-2 type transport system permease protein
MSGVLLRRTIAANRILLIVTGAAMLVWGAILPAIFATFGEAMGDLIQGNALLQQFSRFGGGDLFSLAGTIALGFAHPFTLLLMGIVAIGFPATAIAGEREKGTLEVTLARPISRRGLVATLFVAGSLFLAILLALHLVGSYLGALLTGVSEDLDVGRMAQMWLAGWLLFVAFMSLAFTASVMADRVAPALGIPLAFVLVNYLASVIGSLWPDAAWLQDWSMFNLVKAQQILAEGLALSDVAIMVAFTIVFVGVTAYAFPRRDIPAPS